MIPGAVTRLRPEDAVQPRVISFVRFGLLGIAGIAATLLPLASASSQEQSQGPRLTTSGWTVSCQSAPDAADLICEAAYALTLESTQEVFATVFLSRLAQAETGPTLALRLQLPHGVRIPEGVALTIDETPAVQATIQTSGPAGLFARVELTPDLRALLEAGDAMTVSFDAMTGQTWSFPVGLKGFSKVTAKLD